LQSIVAIQSAWRVYRARQRIGIRREFVRAKREAKRAADGTMGYDLLEMLSAEPPVPIRLLHLLRAMLLLFTAPSTETDHQSDENAESSGTSSVEFARHCNWASLQRIFKRPQLIVAMQRLAKHCWSEKLMLTEAAVKQIRVYLYDPSFTPQAIATIHPGGVTARRLLAFVQSIATMQRLIPHFSKPEDRCPCPNIEDVFAFDTNDDENENPEVAAEGGDTKKKVDKKQYGRNVAYIPDNAMPSPPSPPWPRPVLVALSRDVPRQRRRHCSYLCRTNCPEFLRV